MVDLIILVIALVAMITASFALLLAVRVRDLTRYGVARHERVEPTDGRRPLAAVVVNPSKFTEIGPLRASLEQVCDELGWAPPLWLETTQDDPGTGQARHALAAGATVVVAIGGDGTVRSVAEVLSGTGVALGLVPAGTGNLLARNLDFMLRRSPQLSPMDAKAAMQVALTGDDRPIDVGWVTLVAPDGTARSERAFLVMAGMGFDAAIMEGVPESLKAKVGPVAYFVSGLRQFNGDRVRMAVTVDGVVHTRKVRTVVVGNVGRVQGGLALMPDAEVDDGYLDVMAVGPNGVLQWLHVARRVITRHRRADASLAHWRGREIRMRAERPQPAQIDGDPVGEAGGMVLRVSEHSLLVRVAPEANRPSLRELASAGLAGHRERLEERSGRLANAGRTQPAEPASSRSSHARAAVKSSSLVPGEEVGA